MTTTGSGFAHGALFYEGVDGFLAGTVPFLTEGLAAGEPMLVAVHPEKIEALRGALPDAGDAIDFVDMTELGRNPGRIISAWAAFADQHAQSGLRLRGIGEPVWPGRAPDEVVECQRHEALINVAFAHVEGFELLCPYDRVLEESVLTEARNSHPLLMQDGDTQPSAQYEDSVAPFAGALSPPDPRAETLDLAPHRLREVRRRVADCAIQAGVVLHRIEDLIVAVTEAATNSLRHADGQGVLLMWRDADGFVCEVRDRGRIEDPLAGRLPAPMDAVNGRGLWLIHQLCDFVQIRSSDSGTVVRMYMQA